MAGPTRVAERLCLCDLMRGLWLKHERRSWLVLRRSCAKEEEESVLILAQALMAASERAYISHIYFREIIHLT
jgi:hypothetical protein